MKFWLIDSGSATGTYISVSPTEPLELKRNQSFLLGLYINIEIDDVQNTANHSSTSLDLSDTDLEDDMSGPKLSLTVYRSEPNEDGTLVSYPFTTYAQNGFASVVIGRAQGNDIVL
jgi:hypothetical protein